MKNDESVSQEVKSTASEDTASSESSAGHGEESKSSNSEKGDLDKNLGPLPGDGTEVSSEVKFTPNYKYRVANEEKEIDDFFKPLIKDADSEKKIKDILTRSEGLDYVKSKRDQALQAYDELNQEYSSLRKDVNAVLDSVDKKDYTSLFRQLRIDPRDVIKWVDNYISMTPEQHALEDFRYKQREEVNLYNQELMAMRQLLMKQEANIRENQLDVALSQRADVSEAAKSWDNKVGIPGAFKQLVIEEGQKAATLEQRDLSVAEAIDRVMRKFGSLVYSSKGSAGDSSQQLGPKALDKKPVIPVINGSSSKSPIAKPIRSIDDLRKKYKELEANESL